jgi:hypothetical protein
VECLPSKHEALSSNPSTVIQLYIFTDAYIRIFSKYTEGLGHQVTETY